MTSSTYVQDKTGNTLPKLTGLPLHGLVTRSGVKISIHEITLETTQMADLQYVHGLLNNELEQGNTWPNEDPMDFDNFCKYFLSHNAFVVRSDEDNHARGLKQGQILGTFYIKPNFPGRCSHICNGGFIVPEDHRKLGVGLVMARHFKLLARRLGYKASMFNLVFDNNPASVNTWKKEGFAIIGVIPKAGRLKNSETLVDANIFHFDLETIPWETVKNL